ncbi:MAG: hypothetical protein AABX13_02515 [Nanoarchaeota archaeon]
MKRRFDRNRRDRDNNDSNRWNRDCWFNNRNDRKRGEVRVGAAAGSSSSSSSSAGKHKAWLIVGMVIAAVLILSLGYFAGKQGVGKEGFAGKATGTGAAIKCVKVTDLPISAGASSSDKEELTAARQNVCLSQTGCSFSANTAASTTDDACTGKTLSCPDVSLYPGATSSMNTGRKNACENAGCIFKNGGDNGPTGDTCSPKTATPLPETNLCGNGVINTGESCDGTDFGVNTCASVKGADWTGPLTCSSDCKSYSLTQCYICGNEQKEGAEACDGLNFGNVNPNDLCAIKAGYTGIPTCATNCLSYSLDSCMKCGDGKKTGGEVCDQADVGTASCASVKGAGWGGPLICKNDCSGYDTQYCNELQENCLNSIDDDGDGNADGLDSDCRNQPCLVGDNTKKWVWSYNIFDVGGSEENSEGSKCCALNQCVFGDQCQDFDVPLSTAPVAICGNNNDWIHCTAGKEGQASDGGGYECKSNGNWEVKVAATPPPETVIDLSETPGCGNAVCNSYENCASCAQDCGACTGDTTTTLASQDTDGDGITDDKDYCPGTPGEQGLTYDGGYVLANGCFSGDSTGGGTTGGQPDGCITVDDIVFINDILDTYGGSCTPITYGAFQTASDCPSAADTSDCDSDGIANAQDYCPNTLGVEGLNYADGYVGSNGCYVGDVTGGATTQTPNGCITVDDIVIINDILDTYGGTCQPLS